MENRGKLERGTVTAELVRHLAERDLNQTELAAKYSVTRASVSAFAKRHTGEIERYRERLDITAAGLWVADRDMRLAEIQTVIVETRKDLDDPKAGASVPKAENRRVILQAVRNAAEELGQLPSKSPEFLANVQTINRIVFSGVTQEEADRMWNAMDKPWDGDLRTATEKQNDRKAIENAQQSDVRPGAVETGDGALREAAKGVARGATGDVRHQEPTEARRGVAGRRRTEGGH